MRKTIATTVFAVAFTASFAAYAAKDSVTIGMRLEPPGLDPTTGAAAAISQITLYNLFEGLTKITPAGGAWPKNGLAWKRNGRHSGSKWKNGPSWRPSARNSPKSGSSSQRNKRVGKRKPVEPKSLP